MQRERGVESLARLLHIDILEYYFLDTVLYFFSLSTSIAACKGTHNHVLDQGESPVVVFD